MKKLIIIIAIICTPLISLAGLSFNKTNRDYVQRNGLLGSPVNVTVSAWANLNSADTKGAEIISLGDHVAMRLDQNEVTPFTGVSFFYRHSAGWRATYGGTNYAGTGWHHFAYVVDDTGNSQKIYVDGALASTTSFTESIQWTTQGTNTFIGRHGNGGTTYDFDGKIAEVRIYNRVLSAGEIKMLYRGWGSRNGLVGYWPLWGNSGTYEPDLSGRKNYGTTIGAVRSSNPPIGRYRR